MSELPVDGPGKSRDEIAEAYRSPPWWYDVRGFFILTFAYNNSLPAQIRQFYRNFGRDHLEIACGTGTLLSIVLLWRRVTGKLPSNITGIDYAKPMLEGAKTRFKGRSNMRFLHADAAALPFDTASFDTANIANSIHCFPQVQEALNEVFRVLKPSGTLAANVLIHPRTRQPLKRIAEIINEWGAKKGILKRPYDPAEIFPMIALAGFEIIKYEINGNCLNFTAIKL